MDWKKPADALPIDGQVCVLLTEPGSLFGPIAYQAKDGMDGWLDLFGANATAEGGTFIKKDHAMVAYWRDAGFLDFPDDYSSLTKHAT